MAYCAICGRNHDPNSPCGASAEQGPLGYSKKKRSRRDRLEFEEASKKADRFVIILAVIFGVIFIAILIVHSLTSY